MMKAAAPRIPQTYMCDTALEAVQDIPKDEDGLRIRRRPGWRWMRCVRLHPAAGWAGLPGPRTRSPARSPVNGCHRPPDHLIHVISVRIGLRLDTQRSGTHAKVAQGGGVGTRTRHTCSRMVPWCAGLAVRFPMETSFVLCRSRLQPVRASLCLAERLLELCLTTGTAAPGFPAR